MFVVLVVLRAVSAALSVVFCVCVLGIVLDDVCFRCIFSFCFCDFAVRLIY